MENKTAHMLSKSIDSIRLDLVTLESKYVPDDSLSQAIFTNGFALRNYP